jgi:S1-C subfamily serine protease
MKGMLLPGKGIGIEAIEPGSPAQLVGLQQGMVMTVCNGIQLVDEASMQEAIRISGGLLQMTLLSADGSQVLQGTVQMTQIAAVAF